MKSIFHGLIGMLLGGAAGSAITYYILNNKLKKQYEIKMTEELTQFKHDFKIEKYEEHLEKKEEESKENMKKVEETIAKHGPDPRDKSVVDTHKTDYTKPKSDEKEEEDMSDYVDFIDTVPLEERNPLPYIIKEEEHYAGPKYYDFEEYSYILPNEDVIDDEDNVLTEVEKVLGYKNLEELNNCQDGDYIYIRNEIYECDYCVTLIDWRDKV